MTPERPCSFPKCDREALPFRNRCAQHLGEPLPEGRLPEWRRRLLPAKDMTRAA